MIRLTMSCCRQLTSAAEFFSWRWLAGLDERLRDNVIARGQLSVFLIRQLKNKNKMSTLFMQWCGKRHFRVSRNYLNAHRQIYLVISKISDQTNLNIQIFSPYFSRIQTNEIHFQRSSTNRRHTYQFKK